MVDSSGSRITASTAVVTATVSSGATLVGTTTATSVAGHATFTNLGVTGTVGTAYTLTFSSTGLTSTATVVTPSIGAVSKLGIVTSASPSLSGAVFATQPRVSVMDAAGNITMASTATVTATVSVGGALSGTASVGAVAGVAAFSNLAITGGAGTYTLTFTSTGLTSATQTLAITVPEVPRVTSISPSSGWTTGGTTIAIYGSGFTGSETVAIGGLAAAGVTVSSSTTIIARTPASATTGAVAVAVSCGGSTGTLANAFVYLRPGSSLGGGVYEPTSSNPPGVRLAPLTKAARSVNAARNVSVTVNQPTKLRLSGVPKKTRLKAEVKVGSSWKSFGSAKSNSKGQITLAPLTFTRANAFVVRVRKGKKSYYVLANS